MPQNRTQNNAENIGCLAYILSFLSFLPFVGVLFGAVAMIWGLKTKTEGGKGLAIIGAAGIGFTLLLCMILSVFFAVQKTTLFDSAKEKIAKVMLADLVESIEYHKVQYGTYPKDLNELMDKTSKDEPVIPLDPFKIASGETESALFYYENNDDTYFLLGEGPDNKPFTADDILPDIIPKGNVGYRVKKIAQW